eukprot:TRINITY_DN300_c0_g1_i11.p1 TRINITY_DN300_c0_g1~~TRINITY_DN300_c0_g1_i11.p1  ORF type:complete len:382 (+),score=104.10 TRINITY_DN300_c0_g1_i11:78-1148(+)
MKVAFLTGITGQDGLYLTELLLGKGYTVHGLVRRSSSSNTARIDSLLHGEAGKEGRLVLHYGDLTDSSNLLRLIGEIRPDEVYNLGAQSHVAVSFETAEYTANADALGVLRLLEAIRICGLEKKTRFYQASTSELFGKVQEIPQTEKTPFYPRSPYSVAKLYGYWITVNYRESHGIFGCNGVLFNHESPERGVEFVTRKITSGLAQVYKGSEECIRMGNMDALRDWGHARDYVECMWKMLQRDVPDDYVICSGEQHSVREFIEKACGVIGWKIRWEGSGVEEVGIRESDGKVIVRVDPRFFRPAEVETLLGDSSYASRVLGWTPHVSFDELVREMMVADMKRFGGVEDFVPATSEK